MTEEQERKTEPAEGGSRIARHIKATKVALKQDNTSLMGFKQGKELDYQLYEYTHSSRRAFIIAKYLYLLTKLLTLYTAKGVGRIVRRIRAEEAKP
jgi:hypothetical protein